MRRASRITLLAALTGVATLVASPALALPSGETVEMPPWTWFIAAGGGQWSVNETSFDDGFITDTNAWDDSIARFYSPDYVAISSASDDLEPASPATVVPFECTSTTLATVGDDQVVSCTDTVTTPWGLSITSDVRILAPGDLARVTFLVTNTTSADFALGYDYSWTYGSSRGHVRSSEPGVEQTTGLLASPDVWSFNRGESSVESSNLSAGVAWGIDGQPFVGGTSTHNGTTGASVILSPSEGATLAAGQTIALAFFHKVQAPQPLLDPEPQGEELGAASTDADDTAIDNTATNDTGDAADTVVAPASGHDVESFMAEFSSFDGRLTRGLPSDVTVGNWQTADAAETPELADTGAGIDEQLLLGGLAAALLGAGTALVMIRRPALRASAE